MTFKTGLSLNTKGPFFFNTGMPNRGTQLLYYTLLAIQLIFGLLTWVLIQQSEGTVMMSGRMADLYLPVLVIMMSGGVAYFIDQSRANQATRFSYAGEQATARYRITVLLRSAIVQSGNLLALSMALVTKRPELLALIIPGLLLFAYFRPTISQFNARYANN